MKKKTSKIASLALASSVVLSGIPFNAVSAAGMTQIQGSYAKEMKGSKAASKTTAVRISNSLNTNSKKKISVIVQLKSEPVAVVTKLAGSKGKRKSASAVESSISKEQSAFKKAASKANIDLDVDRQFNYLINAVELTLPANQIPNLAKLPNVLSVYENGTYFAQPLDVVRGTELPQGKYDSNPLKQIGVPEAWAAGYTGKDVKVGVIDTGVDYKHPDLKDAYKGGWDSIDDDDDPYETMPLQKYPTEHGTHVSGTIAGRSTNTESDVTVRGVAYDADLYVYRVLGPSPQGGSGSTAQVVDGIEHAVQDGMDVINLSLGSDLMKDPFSPESIVLNNAALMGVVAVVANGNAAADVENQWYYTSGSPANALLPISVGAATAPVDKYIGTGQSSFGTSHELPVAGWETGHEDFASILGTGAIPTVYANLGSEEDFSKVDVKGKVALVSRGAYAFVDKIHNAKNAGAIAIVIFNGNDVDGDGVADLDIPDRAGHFGVLLGDDSNFIPTFDMSGLEGRALAKEALANPNKPLTLTFGSTFDKLTIPGDTMADFSSRGPSMDGNYSIKPDMVAPGVSILSSVPAYGKEYGDDTSYKNAYARFSGTSMATPHVAGLAALLRQAHSDWTAFDIKAALANTADSLNDPQGVMYDVYSQGAGRVNVAAAIKTPALLETVEEVELFNTDHTTQVETYNGDNISFGLMEAGSDAVTKELQLKNTSDDAVAYEAEIVMHDSVTTDPYDPKETPNADEIKAELSKKTIEADGNDVSTFELELAPSDNAVEGVYEGEVLLKSKDGNPDLHLPFVVHVGDKRENTHFGFDKFELSNHEMTPNGDGEDDTFDVTALLQADDVNLVTLEVWGYDDRIIGTMSILVDTDKTGEPTYKNLEPGELSFTNIDDTYVDGTKDARGREFVKHLPNGEYAIRISGYAVDPQDPKIDVTYPQYQAWKNFSVKDSGHELDKEELKKDVARAVASFEPNSVNTKVIGDAVLSLPSHLNKVTYEVVSTSKKALVSSDGILLALPDRETKVKLKVKIASAYDESIKEYVYYEVKLPAKK